MAASITCRISLDFSSGGEPAGAALYIHSMLSQKQIAMIRQLLRIDQRKQVTHGITTCGAQTLSVST